MDSWESGKRRTELAMLVLRLLFGVWLLSFVFFETDRS
jgi:hypothetical protein